MDRVAPFRMILTSLAVCVGWVLATPGNAWSQSNQLVRQKGCIFLDGKFLAPPYQMDSTSETLTINGFQFTSDSFDLTDFVREEHKEFEGRRSMRFGGRGWPRYRESAGPPIERVSLSDEARERWREWSQSPIERFADQMQAVRTDSIAILYSGERPLLVHLDGNGCDLLRALRHPSAEDRASITTLKQLDGYAAWAQLLQDFKPDPVFSEHADGILRIVDNAEADADRVAWGVYLIDKLSYPLTVFAMAVVVLGFGHLLSNRPKIESTDAETVDWTKHRKVVGQSLLIVGLLSAIDLIWTLVSANAGMMRELNPVGSGLVAEPVRLFLFKFGFTAVSIGILYRLHRRPFAQVASWWSCLLLTLLTARWLVFQSMFM